MYTIWCTCAARVYQEAIMATATSRVPVLMTEAEKARIVKKAFVEASNLRISAMEAMRDQN